MKVQVNQLNFFVPGIPEPGGSKTCIIKKVKGRMQKIYLDANPKVKGWKKIVSQVAKFKVRQDPFECALFMRMNFVLPRPASHYRSGRYSHLLKDSSPLYHIYKPDMTKLLRGTEDALKGICFVDDDQVCDNHSTKRYSEGENDPCGVYITIQVKE